MTAQRDRVVLRNLLQREGYESIQAVLEEGIDQGVEQGVARSILTLLEGRGLSVDATVRERVTGSRNAAELERWLLRAAQVRAARQIFD